MLPEILSEFNRADYDVHTYVTAQQGDGVQAVENGPGHGSGGLLRRRRNLQ